MLQCLEGVKHLCAVVVNCCDADLYKQPKGLEDPEALARETVCMLPIFVNHSSLVLRSVYFSDRTGFGLAVHLYVVLLIVLR